MTRTLLAALLILSPCAQAATDIGVAAAVRGTVNATAPGAAGRAVTTGKAVFHNDKVSTGADSKLQVLLLDETCFTVGANAEMILDEFVYDPATDSGKVSARVAKGAFRFNTGKVARKNPSNMKVDTPVATIGIRGTMVAGSVGNGEATIVLLGPGQGNNADEKGGAFTVKNQYGSTDVDKDGWGVTVKDGQAPSEPFQLGPGQLDGILAGVGSAPKGDSKDDSGAGDSAGDASGDSTAGGKENVKDVFAAIDSAQSDVSAFASQQFGAPKTSKWDDVRGIQSGSGVYTAAGVFYNCTSGTCDGPIQGNMSFVLNVDFGAKTLGGGSSGITMQAPGNPGTANINSFSYAGFTGDASINLQPFISGSNWSGTSLKLLDAGGVTAGQASIDVRWNTGIPPTYGGVLTGSR